MIVFSFGVMPLVYVREFERGDIAIWHKIDESTRNIVEPICRAYSGRWDDRYNNWVIRKEYATSVLAEFEKKGKRIS